MKRSNEGFSSEDEIDAKLVKVKTVFKDVLSKILEIKDVNYSCVTDKDFNVILSEKNSENNSKDYEKQISQFHEVIAKLTDFANEFKFNDLDMLDMLFDNQRIYLFYVNDKSNYLLIFANHEVNNGKLNITLKKILKNLNA